MSTRTDADRDRVQTLESGFELLEYVREHDGATLSELTAAFDRSKSSVHRYVTTMADMGYLVREGEEYHISLKFLRLGGQARHRKSGYGIAREKVFELVRETGERALFLVEERGQGVYAYRAGNAPPSRGETKVGERRPLHALAAGKALLAQWPDERIEAFLAEQDLDELTAQTITDPEALWAEVERIREQGYALNDAEQVDGLRAVGAPVFGPDGDVIGGLSVFGPASRFEDDRFREELPRLVTDKADEIHVRLTCE